MTAEPLRYGRGALRALPDPPTTEKTAHEWLCFVGRVSGGGLRFWVVERGENRRFCLAMRTTIHRSNVRDLEPREDGRLPTAVLRIRGESVPELLPELYRGRIVRVTGRGKRFPDGTGLHVEAKEIRAFDDWRDVPQEDFVNDHE